MPCVQNNNKIKTNNKGVVLHILRNFESCTYLASFQMPKKSSQPPNLGTQESSKKFEIQNSERHPADQLRLTFNAWILYWNFAHLCLHLRTKNFTSISSIGQTERSSFKRVKKRCLYEHWPEALEALCSSSRMSSRTRMSKALRG